MSEAFQRAIRKIKDRFSSFSRRRHAPDVREHTAKIVLGRVLALPDDLADTAHLSILNFPAETSGTVVSVTLHLGQEPPGNGRKWEVLTYKMVGGHRFMLVARSRVQVDVTCRRPQTVTLVPPLPIKQGEFVGLVNRDGKLRLTYTRGWEQEVATWDLWYQESQPPEEVGVLTSPLFMWNGSVGWYAQMDPDDPEPAMSCPAATLAADFKRLVNDAETANVTFLCGSDPPTKVYAHRAILVARSAYFRALLCGGFSEHGAQQLKVPEIGASTLLLILEFIYTDRVETLTAEAAVPVLRWAARYCLPRLLAHAELLLRDMVSKSNVAQMTELAASCHAMQLQAYCVHYMTKHRISSRISGGDTNVTAADDSAAATKESEYDAKVGN